MAESTLTKSIEDVGFGITGNIGGLKKTKYWTPDGRTMFAIPNIRDYVIKNKAGDVIEQGTRDANLDKGWLPSRPQVLKLYCPNCDRWHDNQAEILSCAKVVKKDRKAMDSKAQKEIAAFNKDNVGRISALEQQIEKLTKLITEKLK